MLAIALASCLDPRPAAPDRVPEHRAGGAGPRSRRAVPQANGSKAYLHPVNPNDPDEGSFNLKTAFILQKTQQE